jgi:ABC-type nitrate/sulfonate/bicarbonate transport system ATPase subunit
VSSARPRAPSARLSGGEAIGGALAALFLRRPDIVLLDEPTNNLDLASVRQLSGALESYRGAMLVASHDVPFLCSVGDHALDRPRPRRGPGRHRFPVTIGGPRLLYSPTRPESARLRGRTGPKLDAIGVWGNWQPDRFWPC